VNMHPAESQAPHMRAGVLFAGVQNFVSLCNKRIGHPSLEYAQL
jgi:hypothetical protein